MYTSVFGGTSVRLPKDDAALPVPASHPFHTQSVTRATRCTETGLQEWLVPCSLHRQHGRMTCIHTMTLSSMLVAKSSEVRSLERSHASHAFTPALPSAAILAFCPDFPPTIDMQLLVSQPTCNDGLPGTEGSDVQLDQLQMHAVRRVVAYTRRNLMETDSYKKNLTI